MEETAGRILIFFTIGLGFLILSKRYFMSEYGPQTASWRDFAFVSASLLIDESLIKLIPPLVIGAIDAMGAITFPVLDMVDTWSIPAQVLAYAVFSDFCYYWMHRWMHTRFAWPVHALHHSAKKLNFMVSMRTSPINVFLTTFPAIIGGIVFLRSANMATFVFLVSIQAVILALSHTNIRLPFASWIEYVLNTPRLHFVHHNKIPKFSNSNYGFAFSIWDRMFGTFVSPDSLQNNHVLGLDYEQSDLQMFFCVREKNTPEELKRRQAA